MQSMFRFFLAAGIAVASIASAIALPDNADQHIQATTVQSHDRIVREVRHELLMLPQFSIYDNLSYKVEDNTVTLLGQVRNAVLKDEAQAAVRRIEGVQQVNNQIEILPASFNDDRIRRQVARVIFRQPRLFEYSTEPVPSIHIIVRNGHVNLEGVVRDQGDKDVAGIQANGVSGVFSVQNNLQVENPKLARK